MDSKGNEGDESVAVAEKSDMSAEKPSLIRSLWFRMATMWGGSKGLKLMNPSENQSLAEGSGVKAAVASGNDDAFGFHLLRIKNGAEEESDEEDEDYVPDKDDGGSPTDDSDASDSGEETERLAEREKIEPTASKPLNQKPSKDGEESGSKKRKRKTKDPNAPKKAMSGFMFFSQAEQETVRRENPGIAFTEVGKVLGEKWRNLSAEEKEPYEAKARIDKKRYNDQKSDYMNPQSANAVTGNDSDSH